MGRRNKSSFGSPNTVAKQVYSSMDPRLACMNNRPILPPKQLRRLLPATPAAPNPVHVSIVTPPDTTCSNPAAAADIATPDATPVASATETASEQPQSTSLQRAAPYVPPEIFERLLDLVKLGYDPSDIKAYYQIVRGQSHFLNRKDAEDTSVERPIGTLKAQSPAGSQSEPNGSGTAPEQKLESSPVALPEEDCIKVKDSGTAVQPNFEPFPSSRPMADTETPDAPTRAAEDHPEADVPTTNVKRKRGRPSIASKAQNLHKLSETIGIVKRGRGRPRKFPLAVLDSSQIPDRTTGVMKRKRGRPSNASKQILLGLTPSASSPPMPAESDVGSSGVEKGENTTGFLGSIFRLRG